MIAESQIRENLGRFLRREWSCEQFEDWLVQRSWNMHKDSDKSAQELVSAIELRLAEFSSGHLDECTLRDELRSYGSSDNVQIASGEVAPLLVDEPNRLVANAGPPNNIVLDVGLQLIAFIVRATPSLEALGFADTRQSVVS